MKKHWAWKSEHDDMPRGAIVPGRLFRVLPVASLPIWPVGRTGLGTPERLELKEHLIILDSANYFGVTFICTKGIASSYLNHIQECCIEV